jgi:two-component system chemotaxis sensor kinase CheA
MSDYLDPNNEELLKDFFSEAQLQVEQLEQNILVIENDPTDHDAIDEIFRAAHTLKGASGTVQMMELAGFTHLVEDLLDAIRNDAVGVDGELVDSLLASIDVIKAMLEKRLEGEIFKGDITELKKSLQSFLPSSGKKAPPPKTQVKKDLSPPEASGTGGLSEYDILELREAAGKDKTVFQVLVTFDESNPMNSVGGIQVFAALKNIGQILRTEPEFEKLYEDTFYPEVSYFIATARPEKDIYEKLHMPDVIQDLEVLPLGIKNEMKTLPKEVSAPRPAALKASSPNDHVITPDVKEKKSQIELVEENEPEEAEGLEKVKDAGLTRKPGAQGSILRVDSRRIDNLLNLVSETVISKATFNQVANEWNETLSEFHSVRGNFSEKLRSLFDSFPGYLENLQNGGSLKDVKRDVSEKYGELFTVFDPFEGLFKSTMAKFRGNSQNLGRIAGELQEGVMRIRMVPISQIFSRFPRLVRDLSRTLKRKINLVIEGEDTELDKSVIEDLLDPLIHCVRNSIDHGIENPDERLAAGKPEDGTITLKARNEGNMIVIEVSDDGHGIDVEKVRAKAIERGVIHPNKNLTDIEAFNLIFEPGFSTAKAVTNISGRGVGLDVVRRQIEKLNGSVTVSSERGRMTTFLIKLPLTLAIIQGLLIRVGKERYAIPISSVIDSHRIRPSDIKLIDNYEVFNVREDVVSIIRLNRLFRIPTDEQSDYYFVVIVGSGDNKMGLVVDSLIGEEDVVIKPLKDQYTNVPGIAGANITGDGTVSLIIDVPQLLELGLRREVEERKKREAVIR